MGDTYRRNESPERRPYYHNRSWINGQRPQFPSRSYSNPADPRAPKDRMSTSTMDLRKDKRPASRSPDGGPHPKQARTAPTDADASRRSSVSNDTPRHPGLTSPAGHERRPSIHATADLKSKDVNSPNARSGRSTPMHNAPDAQLPLTTATAAPVSMGEGSASIWDALMQFSSSNAAHAILRYQKEEAAAAFMSADSEYKANECHFIPFPAIKDRKAAARDAAQKKLTTIESQLKAHEMHTQPRMQALAKIIEDAATPKQPVLVKEDFVSVEAFERLRSSYEELKRGEQSTTASIKVMQIEVKDVRDRRRDTEQKLHDTMEAQEKMKGQMARTEERHEEVDGKLLALSGTVEELSSIKENAKQCSDWMFKNDSRITAVDALVRQTRVLESNNATLMAWKAETVDPALADVSSIKKRLKDVEEQSEEIKDALGILQAARLSQDAHQARAAEIQPTSLQAIESRLAEAETSTKRIQDDMKKLHDSQGQGYASKKDYDELLERQDKFDQDLGGLKKTISKRGTVSQGSENVKSNGNVLPPEFSEDEFRSTVQMLAAEGPELINKVDQLQQGLQAMVEKIDGKDNNKTGVVSRLDAIDDKIHNFERHVVGHSGDRPREHENEGPAPTDIDYLKEDVEELWSKLKALVGVINADVDERVQGLRNDLSRLTEASANQGRSLDGIRSDIDGKVSELRAMVNTSFQTKEHATDEVQKLKKEIDGDVDQKLKTINDQINGLKQQQARGPMLPPPSDQQQQHQQISRRSPSMPNGRTPSPLVNEGFIPSSHTHGHHTPLVQAPAPQQQQQMGQLPAQNPYYTQARLDQITMVLDQLKRRYDNLTTDEMVKVMLKQLEAVWPHAGKYEAACKGLWVAIQENNKWLSGLQERLNQVDRVQASSTNSGNTPAELQQATADFKNLEKMVTELKTLCEKHDQLFEEVDVKQLGTEIEKVWATMGKHEERANADSKAVGRAQGSVTSVQNRLATLTGQFQAMEEVVNSLT